jgi:hypothetical protein
MWPSETEVIQACAGLRVWPGGDCKSLWIPGLAGLKGSFGRDHVEVWGSTALEGQRSRAGGSEIIRCAEQQLRGPMVWGLACCTGYSFSI